MGTLVLLHAGIVNIARLGIYGGVVFKLRQCLVEACFASVVGEGVLLQILVKIYIDELKLFGMQLCRAVGAHARMVCVEKVCDFFAKLAWWLGKAHIVKQSLVLQIGICQNCFANIVLVVACFVANENVAWIVMLLLLLIVAVVAFVRHCNVLVNTVNKINCKFQFFSYLDKYAKKNILYLISHILYPLNSGKQYIKHQTSKIILFLFRYANTFEKLIFSDGCKYIMRTLHISKYFTFLWKFSNFWKIVIRYSYCFNRIWKVNKTFWVATSSNPLRSAGKLSKVISVGK